MPDVRNMLLEEQTQNLEWLVLPKACMCWLILDAVSLPAGCSSSEQDFPAFV